MDDIRTILMFVFAQMALIHVHRFLSKTLLETAINQQYIEGFIQLRMIARVY